MTYKDIAKARIANPRNCPAPGDMCRECPFRGRACQNEIVKVFKEYIGAKKVYVPFDVEVISTRRKAIEV